MPFADYTKPETAPVVSGFEPRAYVPPEMTWSPDLSTIASDSFNFENTVGSVARHLGDRWSLYYAQQSGWDPLDEDYEPFDDPEAQAVIQDRPELAHAFANSRSRFESDLIRRRIEEEDDAHEALSRSGWAGAGLMIASGVLDPVNLLPVGAGFRALKIGRTLRGAAEGATAGFVAGGAYESVMQATQETRTPGESLTNIAATTLLSGALGGGLALVKPEARAAMAEAFAKEVREAHEAWNGAQTPRNLGELIAQSKADRSQEAFNRQFLDGGGGSVGAAATRATTLADETRVATGVRAERAGELPIVGNPMGRLSASPSLYVRRVARDLSETAYHFMGEKKGFAAPQAVETLAKQHQGPLAIALGIIDHTFAQHRGLGGKFAAKLRAGIEDVTGRRNAQRLDNERYMQRVGMAARRGDADPMPEVKAAAEAAREHIEALKQKAINVGLLSEDVHTTTADSYLTRVYNVQKIKAQRPKVQDIIFDWIKGLREASEEKARQVNSWAKIAERAKANLERLATELKKQQDFDVAGIRAEGREKAKAASALQREVDIRDRRVKQLQRRLATAQTRTVKPTERVPKDHPLAQDLENARTAKEPERLIERVRKMGGLKDSDGLLKQRGFKPIKMRNGKALKTKDWKIEIIDPEAKAIQAKGLDQVANEVAAQEGFLERRIGYDGHIEDTPPDDLVEALERDAFGEPVYAEYGGAAEDVHRWRAAQNFRAELEAQKIDINWSNERIGQELGLIDEFVPNTPGVRERKRGAEFYERRVADDLANEEKAFREAVSKLGKAQAEANDALGRAGRMRARIDGMKRERSASQRAHDKYSKLVEAQREIEVMSDADLRDISRQVVDKMLGHEDAGAIDVDGTPNLRGALLERTLTIPDQKIEEFLDSNIERVLRKYTRQMGADIELTKKFGRPDMKDQFDELRQEYEKVRKGVKDEKAMAALDRQMKRDVEDLALMRDRIRGNAGAPKDPEAMMVRGFRLARNLNYVRLMGGATTASLADAGAVVMTHGFSRVFGKQGMRALVEAFKGMRGVKGAADEVRRAGTALDVVLDTRAHTLAEVGDDYGQYSQFERAAQYATSKFGLANVLSIWTGFWKQFSGVIEQTRILEEAERVATGTATAAEKEHLAYLGIDYDMATRLNLQQKQHATIEPNLRTANTAKWDDPEAVEAMRGAIVKGVDVTIVTPGAGDKPSWMSTEWGKAVGQFKSFSLSAMARTTTRGLQQRDAAALQGLGMMVTLGMLSYYLKTRDEDIDWDNPLTWIKEGVDRSGVTGWIFDALNTQEKILGGFGINAAIGSPSARYASRNATGAILGPTFGLGEEAIRLLNNIGKGEWSAADTHRIRKLLPAQNLFYLRWMFDQAEKGINEGLGVPDRRKPFKRRNDY